MTFICRANFELCVALETKLLTMHLYMCRDLYWAIIYFLDFILVGLISSWFSQPRCQWCNLQDALSEPFQNAFCSPDSYTHMYVWYATTYELTPPIIWDHSPSPLQYDGQHDIWMFTVINYWIVILVHAGI